MAMDVPNQGAEVPLRGHVDPSEALLKKAARPAIGFVDGFGVAVEEVRELLRNLPGLRDLEGLCIGVETFQVFKTWKVSINSFCKKAILKKQSARV